MVLYFHLEQMTLPLRAQSQWFGYIKVLTSYATGTLKTNNGDFIHKSQNDTGVYNIEHEGAIYHPTLTLKESHYDLTIAS